MTPQTEVSESRRYEELVISDYSVSFGLTWKDIIFLPFYRVSVYGFIFVVYASIVIAVFLITYQPNVGNEYDVLFHVVTTLDFLFLARTVLTILHKLFQEHRVRKIYLAEPTFLLIIDSFTLIPVAPYCFLINRFDWYNPIDYRIGYYYSSALKLPRIIRLFYTYQKIFNDLARHPRTVILYAHFMLSALVILILGSFYFTIFYYSTETGYIWSDNFEELERFNISYKTPFICSLYAGGFYFKDILTPSPRRFSEIQVVMVAVMMGYICHSVYLTSHLIAVYVQLMRFKHFYEYRLLRVSMFTRLLKFDQSLQDAINTYYRTIWQTRGGFVEQPEIVHLFPLQLKTEIAMDLYFDAIRHTKIFENLSDASKKELSLLFETEVYIPGQLMFQKDKIKSKLVYLHSGIVAVMSNENRDSPVLSFSPGTILGEICCLMPYACSADVRCSTTCVAHVLRHRAFKRLISRDYSLYLTMRSTMKRRIQYARKKLHRMRWLENPISHIYWIKYRWRKLRREDSTNIVSVKADTTEPLTKYYCSRYLNLLVLSTYYELKVHSICIRGKCSFVMEPDSSFRKMLDLFCTLCVILHFFITFYLIIFEGEITLQIFALLTLFDLVYLLDIYFQAITAVRVHNVFVSKPMDILVHKCKQFRFLLDVFASVPYDYFALLMGTTPYYVGLCRLPKYMKLIKIIEFLNANEQMLMVSPRTMKILKSVMIHFFFILICTCFIYMWTCFETECRSNGWLSSFKVKVREDFGKELNTSDFLISLIYTASVYLQMKIHHVEPANIFEHLVQFAISVCGLYLLNMTLVQMSGAIALENYPRFLYLYNLDVFESVFQERPELRVFRQKINDFVSMQWHYSNSMQLNDIVMLMNHTSKFVRYKVTYDFTIQTFRKTVVFSCVSESFLELIACYTNLYIIPSGHKLQEPNSSAADLYILLDGFCKVASVAPEDEEKRAEFFYSKYDVFPIVGFFQAVNSFLYIESYTAVTVLTFTYIDFMNVVKARPHDGVVLMAAIKEHLELHKNLITRTVHLPLLHYPLSKEQPPETVNIFDYDAVRDKKGGNTSLEWRKVEKGTFKAKLYAAFTRTFDPNGTYLYYEVFRSILILVEMVSLYLSMLRFIRLSRTYDIINITLLMFHILDLYIRSHVQYFKEEGIRVTKPKATFYYYLNHSFIIDIISSLPYQRMQVFEIFRGRNKNSMNVTVSLIVQPLKLYRTFGLLSFIRKTIGIQHHNTILALTNALAVFIFFSEAAAFSMIITCSLTNDWYWECPSDSWLHHVQASSYWREEDLLYPRAYYEVVISRVMRSTRYYTYHDFLLFLFMGLAVCIMIVWLHASIIGYTAFSTKFMANFQERLRRYNNHASRTQIPKLLRDELMEHYKYVYKKTRTDGPSNMLDTFYPHLRESIQLALYSPALHEVRIFLEVGKDFFRFIVPYITERHYVMNAIILACNDINGSTYLVKKGFVEIFIADRSVAVIGPGGLFGCFKHSGISRSTIHVVAKVHADILAIKTTHFLDVVKPYAQLVQSLRLADLSNAEYFETLDTPKRSSYIGDNIYKFGGCTLKNWYRYTFDDRNRFFVLYRYITEMHVAPISSTVAIISIIIMTGSEESVTYWLVVDAYFLIVMYMTCHIRLTDQESGLIITQVGELTRRYIRSWKFYLDIFTLIPFYLIRDYDYTQYKHGGVFLLNKCSRIMNMLVYYNYNLRTQNVPHHMRLTVLAYFLVFFLNAICMAICLLVIFLEDDVPSNTQVLQYYVYIANIFATAGIDPPPMKNFTECLYMSLSVLTCSFTFVLINAGFCKLAVMIYYSDMDFRRAVITFKAYCQNESVSKPIVNQCWYYLMYLYSRHGGAQFPSLILDAPNYILEAHMLYLAEDLIHNNRLFKYAHHDFLRQMIRHLKYEFIMPGFTIVEIGDKRKRIFFIVEGTVLCCYPQNNEKSYELLCRGSSFGELQALRGDQFTQTYKALTPVQIFGISTADWSYLLDWFPATRRTISTLVEEGI